MAIATGVKNKHRRYDEYARKWKRCRDVVGGQDTIYAGGIAYLPSLKEQDAKEYDAYMRRTPFYNATWRTIAAFVGMLFRKPPTIEVPSSIEELLNDVTMSGTSFAAFAQDCTLEDLEVSRLGVLVDFPRSEGYRPTIAQAEANGLRPLMVQYKAEQIINWEYGFINNKTVLTQVRLLETTTIKKSEFESEEEVRVKVLDLFEGKYRIRLFREENEEQIDGEIYPLMNGKPLSEIPFFFIGPDGTEGALDDPILIDLVDLNIKHYQVSADYEHGCHMAGLPTPVISGYTNNQVDAYGNPVQASFYIGSGTAWVFPDANAKAEYLEFTGQGLQALEKNLDRKENQMAAIGARMLTQEKAGVEASATVAMRHNGEHSILSAIAIAVSSGLTRALKIFCEWAGENGEVKFEINRDFVPLAVDSQLLTSWLSLYQAGRMSAETLFDLIKRADLIASDITFEEEQGRIDANPPPAPMGQDDRPELEDDDEEETKE